MIKTIKNVSGNSITLTHLDSTSEELTIADQEIFDITSTQYKFISNLCRIPKPYILVQTKK